MDEIGRRGESYADGLGQTGDDTGAEAMHDYIESLCDRRAMVRQHARISLVHLGHVAVPVLMQILVDAHSPECKRWEAAKALGEIRDPDAASALVHALEHDRSFGVRWLAADGLVTLGHRGLQPLLEALIERPDSGWLREGAHHVLRILAGRGLYDLIGDVIEALEEAEPTLTLPLAATASLKKLGKTSIRRMNDTGRRPSTIRGRVRV